MTFTAIHFDQLGPSCTSTCDKPARVALAAPPPARATGSRTPPDTCTRTATRASSATSPAWRWPSPWSPSPARRAGGGYWLVAADGGVFSFGDAGFHGSAGGQALNEPVVGMAVTPDGGGYWLAAGDGGVFAYGDAAFYGSAGSVMLNKPVVGIAATPTGKGYWMVAADGGIFNYGDAGFYGSAGGMALNKPIVGMAPTQTGKGYWLVASDGGIFSYGDAVFHGSAGGMTLNQPMVGMSATADGGGYWMVASDGGVFTYGDAAYLGGALASGCNAGVPQQCALGANGCFAPQSDAACPGGQVVRARDLSGDVHRSVHGRHEPVQRGLCRAGVRELRDRPCTTWSPATACPAGQTCASGVCQSPACTDDCEPGATACHGGSLVTCTGQKAGGCHTWGAPTACLAGQVCQAGGCTASGGAGSGGAGGGTSSGATGGGGTAGGGGSAVAGSGGERRERRARGTAQWVCAGGAG